MASTSEKNQRLGENLLLAQAITEQLSKDIEGDIDSILVLAQIEESLKYLITRYQDGRVHA